MTARVSDPLAADGAIVGHDLDTRTLTVKPAESRGYVPRCGAAAGRH